MSVEQLARDFVMGMTDEQKTLSSATPDATASGGVLPGRIPAATAFKVMAALETAMPDFKIEVQHVVVKDNEAIVHLMWSGTQTAALSLPGMPPVPPSGKKASVKDTFVLTFKGDKVSHLHVESPADGGIPSALLQLGVQAPPR